MKRHHLTALIVGVTVLLAPAAASAATIPVTLTDTDEYGGGAQCSLRDAVQTANADAAFGGCAPQGAFTSDPDVIELPPGNFPLNIGGGENDVGIDNSQRDLDVTEAVTIVATGTGRAIVDGSGLSRVFDLVAGGQEVTLSGLTIQNGKEAFAGGIRNGGTKTRIENSTISGNEATGGVGGGIYSAGMDPELTLENVTVSGNKSTTQGGGVAMAGGTGLLRGVTITQNTADTDGSGGAFNDGGGLYNGAPITVEGTLIAGNTDGSPAAEAPDCDDTAQVLSAGHNLVGDTTGCNFSPGGAGDIFNTPPGLGPLADNGGNSFTHALLTGSPAINKGSTKQPTTDQRGLPRQGLPDIGAYELHACGGLEATILGTNARNTLVGTPQVDAIVAFGGNDIVRARGGGDKVCLGAGQDRARGGGGRDLLRGEAGKDRLLGEAGRDRLIGGPGADLLRGGPGRDILRGGAGRDKRKQ